MRNLLINAKGEFARDSDVFIRTHQASIRANKSVTDDPAGRKQTQHLKSPFCPFVRCAGKSLSFPLSLTVKLTCDFDHLKDT